MLTVLSVFDGISCGQLALQRAGVRVNQYLASEIDKHAMVVTQHNFPQTVQLGDIQQLKASQLPAIDLLIGGSPCQGFSVAGQLLNFDDPRSKLFFEYERLLNELKPKYFLLENVSMKREWQDVISQRLGVQPLKLNSSLVSKQNRVRLYWTNIPVWPLVDKHLMYNQWLYQLGHGFTPEKIALFPKHPTLKARSPASYHRVVVDLDRALKADLQTLRKDKTVTRPSTPEECEELQTLPVGYTAAICKTQRYKCIGNGWNADTVAHIFKFLGE